MGLSQLMAKGYGYATHLPLVYGAIPRFLGNGITGRSATIMTQTAVVASSCVLIIFAFKSTLRLLNDITRTCASKNDFFGRQQQRAKNYIDNLLNFSESNSYNLGFSAYNALKDHATQLVVLGTIVYLGKQLIAGASSTFMNRAFVILSL